MITMDWGMMMENRFNIDMKNIETTGAEVLGAASATVLARVHILRVNIYKRSRRAKNGL